MTLVELLVTMVLLVGGVIWGLYAQFLGLRLTAQAHTALLAVRGVQEYYLEYIRNLPFDQIGGGPGPVLGGPFTIPTTAAPAFGNLPGSQGSYWVQADDGLPMESTNLKRITVRVEWEDPDGRDRLSDLSTTVGRGGLTGN